MTSRRQLIRIAVGGIAAISLPRVALAARRTRVVGIGGTGCTIANKLRESTPTPSHVSICTVGRSGKYLDPDFEIATWFDASASGVEDRHIARAIGNATVVLVIAGLGGRDGTRLTHHFVRVAKASGARTASVLVMPFEFEGDRCSKAQHAASEIANIADQVVIIDNQVLFEQFEEDTFMSKLLEHADTLAIRSTLNILNDAHVMPASLTGVSSIVSAQSGLRPY